MATEIKKWGVRIEPTQYTKKILRYNVHVVNEAPGTGGFFHS